jgi:hypothetical protein
MDSLEGAGIARRRWKEFHDAVPDDVWQDIGEARGPAVEPKNDALDEAIRHDIAEAVIERANLLGFWLAWHLAGGFAELEQGGWHRATIHRRIRRFRECYDCHPDEFRLPWLRLDLDKAWRAYLVELARPLEEPDW